MQSHAIQCMEALETRLGVEALETLGVEALETLGVEALETLGVEALGTRLVVEALGTLSGSVRKGWQLSWS